MLENDFKVLLPSVFKRKKVFMGNRRHFIVIALIGFRYELLYF